MTTTISVNDGILAKVYSKWHWFAYSLAPWLMLGGLTTLFWLFVGGESLNFSWSELSLYLFIGVLGLGFLISGRFRSFVTGVTGLWQVVVIFWLALSVGLAVQKWQEPWPKLLELDPKTVEPGTLGYSRQVFSIPRTDKSQITAQDLVSAKWVDAVVANVHPRDRRFLVVVLGGPLGAQFKWRVRTPQRLWLAGFSSYRFISGEQEVLDEGENYNQWYGVSAGVYTVEIKVWYNGTFAQREFVVEVK